MYKYSLLSSIFNSISFLHKYHNFQTVLIILINQKEYTMFRFRYSILVLGLTITTVIKKLIQTIGLISKITFIIYGPSFLLIFFTKRKC